MVIIITGVSGVGKTTVVRLLEQVGIKRVVTYTSRAKRTGEVDGVDYNFRSRSDMVAWNKIGVIWEMEEYFGNLYGSPSVDTSIPHVVVVDASGATSYKRHYGSACCTVLLTASNSEISRRLAKRNDATETVAVRGVEKQPDASLFDAVIDTDKKTPEHVVYEILTLAYRT